MEFNAISLGLSLDVLIYIIRYSKLEAGVLCLRESLSAALEDRPLPKIQAGHAPHGERPEATHDETTRSRDDETDIQKAEIIWTT